MKNPPVGWARIPSRLEKDLEAKKKKNGGAPPFKIKILEKSLKKNV